MSQLALLLPDNPGPPEFEPLPALLEADMSAAGDFIRDAAAASTRRAYRSDWRLFPLARPAVPSRYRPRLPSSPRSWPQRPIEAPSPAPSRGGPPPSATPIAWPAMPDGYRVLIRHSKTDQEGQGQEVAIPRGYRLRPVEAVQTWLAAAEINDGPVFRPVLKGGRL